jgi:hypothetical protein
MNQKQTNKHNYNVANRYSFNQCVTVTLQVLYISFYYISLQVLTYVYFKVCFIFFQEFITHLFLKVFTFDNL